MVDCPGLENRRTERYRGIESLPLRKKQENRKVLLFCFISDWELAHEAGRKQNKENATAFLFLAKESGSPANSRGLSKKFSQSIEEKLQIRNTS